MEVCYVAMSQALCCWELLISYEGLGAYLAEESAGRGSNPGPFDVAAAAFQFLHWAFLYVVVSRSRRTPI